MTKLSKLLKATAKPLREYRLSSSRLRVRVAHRDFVVEVDLRLPIVVSLLLLTTFSLFLERVLAHLA